MKKYIRLNIIFCYGLEMNCDWWECKIWYVLWLGKIMYCYRYFGNVYYNLKKLYLLKGWIIYESIDVFFWCLVEMNGLGIKF